MRPFWRGFWEVWDHKITFGELACGVVILGGAIGLLRSFGCTLEAHFHYHAFDGTQATSTWQELFDEPDGSACENLGPASQPVVEPSEQLEDDGWAPVFGGSHGG